MDDRDDWIQSIYGFLVLCNIEPTRIVPNYSHSDEARAIVAIPDIEVAITTDKDKVTGFREDGWVVVPLPQRKLMDFHEIFSELMVVFTSNQRASSLNADKSVSQHEQWLIDACLRRQLPVPDRNLKFINPDTGKELTTPDLAWEEEKVAFFVDGLWWHTGQDDKKAMDVMSSDLDEEAKKRKLAKQKSAVEKDGNARSIMTLQGWKVLSCSDRALEKPGGIDEQVDRIEDTLNRQWKAMKQRKKLEEQGIDLTDLFD